jgi:MoxR-like ATPase
MSTWPLYRGDGVRREVEIPDPPPFRPFGRDLRDGAQPPAENDTVPEMPGHQERRGKVYQPRGELTAAVSAALALRRPLLVTGGPGVGKSSLAYAVAYELGLGRVLHWPITSRTVLRDGLYDYDAVARLHDRGDGQRSLDHYITLGPLGTALLPWKRPRVLLIDELDKSDIDLPNDLLHVFEEGSYTISELVRAARPKDDIPRINGDSIKGTESLGRARLLTDDGSLSAEIVAGRVRCTSFPFMVITSNRDREFPPAFNRRCLRVNIRYPSDAELWDIVWSHLAGTRDAEELEQAKSFLEDTVSEYSAKVKSGEITADQVLNAFQLLTEPGLDSGSSDPLKEHLHAVTEIVLRKLRDEG